MGLDDVFILRMCMYFDVYVPSIYLYGLGIYTDTSCSYMILYLLYHVYMMYMDIDNIDGYVFDIYILTVWV